MTGIEYAELVKADERVTALALSPGWQSIIDRLIKQAAIERENVENALDDVLLDDSPENRRKYQEAKIVFLAVEKTVKIYAEIREAASKAKQFVETQGSEALQYL